MANKKFFKIIAIIIFGIMIICTLNTEVLAESSSIRDIVGGGDAFLRSADKNITYSKTLVNDASSVAYNIFLVIGMIIAVIVGIILGIKFMIGSMEQKAQIKEALVPYIIGCVVVFGAFAIWKVVVTVAASI